MNLKKKTFITYFLLTINQPTVFSSVDYSVSVSMPQENPAKEIYLGIP